MNDDAWFEICTGALLMQGDVLQGCEILRPRPANVDGAPEIDADIETLDVIVITQSCDLEHPGKIDDVLLAQISSYDDLVAESKKQGKSEVSSKGFRKKCVRGEYPAYALLREFDGPPRLPWSLVDFRRLFTVPKAILEQNAEDRGDRLRLVSPYREHFAQAFARYFMRVGLPTSADEFEAYEAALSE